MPYRWWQRALDTLVDIEPHEVSQALAAKRRWPRPGVGQGLPALTIWARTDAGRPLIVAVLNRGAFDHLIIGARDMTPAEVTEFQQWEAWTP